ncbi:DNA-binding protein [Lentzea guizhouensis]|uniref:DNA-binding protein n=1 Tax=Lentzea guizhouensis TaxID=1586287 RepID=UPI0008FF6EC4|nr:DNA-binding protein [Lentzea guizhouensis]
MSNADSPKLHKPVDVAKRLGCSEWWVKEQARRRRIPYSWIGGRYLFTDAHINEIVLICEKRPVSVETPVTHQGESPRSVPSSGEQPVVRLRARPPRRARATAGRSTAA